MDEKYSLTVEEAISWLRVHEPHRAATYVADGSTVLCYRKDFPRDARGSIVGFHEGTARAVWMSYRRDVRSYVIRRLTTMAR